MDHCHACKALPEPSLTSTLVALALGTFIFAGGVFHFLPDVLTGKNQLLWFILGFATLAIMYYAGWHFFMGAWYAYKIKAANMNTLIALGTGAAWLYSMIIAIFPNIIPLQIRFPYLDTALIVISLVNIGSYLENRAKKNTSQAINKLLDLQAKTARIIVNNTIKTIPITEIKVDDHLQIRPGEKIPVDGLVIEGASHVDESLLSGEPIPIRKGCGDKVTAGTFNAEGVLVVAVKKIGEDTLLAHMIKRVEAAQLSKVPIARLVDIIASIFVPIVILIAIISSILWAILGPDPKLNYALMTLLSVLLIACPCALGLATPISMTLGIGQAAKKGILIRQAEALQKIKKVHTIIFDKTGTLTAGQADICDIIAYNKYTIREILEYAYTVENASADPIAEAINRYARQENITAFKCDHFESVPGQGVKAFYKNKLIILGNESFLKAHQIDTLPAKEVIEKFNNEGKTAILIAYKTLLIGLIALADPIREDSRMTVKKLRKLGYTVKMLTGDRRPAAKAIAKQIDIKLEDVMAEVLPNEKAEVIAQLQREGWRVAMVGDGINDAAALAQADVGLAMSGGADIAIEAADITLLSNSLKNIVTTIVIAKKTMGNIQQNLFAAFIYNSLAIPLAAGAFYPFTGWLLSPIVAGAAMAASSLTVVLNAMRLNYTKF